MKLVAAVYGMIVGVALFLALAGCGDVRQDATEIAPVDSADGVFWEEPRWRFCVDGLCAKALREARR